MNNLKCCDTCRYGMKRSSFSYKMNGAYYASIECFVNDNGEEHENDFKRTDDCCERYEEKR